jgi:ethanolamine utilization protein EutN
MILGRVVGNVVATSKHELLVGSKILVVQQIRPTGEDIEGKFYVAVDTVGAGPGEQVILALGSSATKACDNRETPVDAAIIGIIDEIDVN